MELREAFWEKRNLGMDTLEINFGNKDIIDDNLENVLSRYGYIVAKVPCGNIKLLHQLEDVGFRFIETQIGLSKTIGRHYQTPDIYKRVSGKIRIKQVLTENDLNLVLEEINKGIFETDRIALDIFFGKEYAANRYCNWIKDELSTGKSRLFVIVYGSNTIGFFLLENANDRKSSIVLGGIYNNYKNFGFGFSFIDESIKLSVAEGKSLVYAKVSSNNLPILKLYSAFGFNISDISYVLRRIIN